MQYLVYRPFLSISSQPRQYPVLIWAPGFGQSPDDYSSVLRQVAHSGYIVVAFYVNWKTCSSTTCGGAGPECALKIMDTFTDAVAWVKDSSSEGLNAKLPNHMAARFDAIAIGAHSGSGWPAMAALTVMPQSDKDSIKGVLLVHPGVVPTKEVHFTVDWSQLANASHAQLMTVCGTMCEYTCDSCLYSAFNALTFCNKEEESCGDCMPNAGCPAAHAYAKYFMENNNNTNLFVQGPWWHTAIMNIMASGAPGVTQCGYPLPYSSPEAAYVLGFLKYSLEADMQALTGLRSLSGQPTSYGVGRCNKKLTAPAKVTLVVDGTSLTSAAELYS